MRRLILPIIALFALSLNAEYLDDGKRIFEKYNCNMCHKLKDAPLSVAPSLAEIRSHYLGNERGLVSFMKGEAKPIVKPELFSMMKQQLFKVSRLSEKEHKALSIYITYEHK